MGWETEQNEFQFHKTHEKQVDWILVVNDGKPLIVSVLLVKLKPESILVRCISFW